MLTGITFDRAIAGDSSEMAGRVPTARDGIREGGRANLKGLLDRHRLIIMGGILRAGPCRVAEMHLNGSDREHTGWSASAPWPP